MANACPSIFQKMQKRVIVLIISKFIFYPHFFLFITMKTNHFLSIIRPGRLLCMLLLLLSGNVWQGCKNANDVGTQGTGLTDPNEITKVLVIPGATVEQGNPPAVTKTGNEPVLSTPTPTVETVSGLDGTYTLNYSNVTGTITAIYIQFDGATSYLKIPISGSTGKSGQIRVPMRMPDDKYTARPSGISFCTFALISNGACQSKCTNSFTSQLPPRPGKGQVNVGGRSVDATAACDLDFGAFGRGYVILTGQGSGVVLYNMRSGTNQLANFETMAASDRYGDSVPFAGYVDENGNVYFSVSGSATVSGKTASVSGIFKNLLSSGQQISVSAAGNCQ